MKNTFKKIIAVISSAAVLMANTATFSVCAVEEETTAQKYTVEDLLPMSKEEICELLGDEAYAYKNGYGYVQANHLLFRGYGDAYVELYDASVYLTDDGAVDVEYLFEDLGLNYEMVNAPRHTDLLEDYFDNGYDVIHFYFDYLYYSEYDFRHVYACIFSSIYLNSNVFWARPSLYAGANKGDADKNGSVNAMDATMAARYAVG